ncbi:MAG: hypothetical protein IRZ20_03995 [Thermoleophilia bacterium]|nr:hypothetical protein [Thermoleophilia bacterium]
MRRFLAWLAGALGGLAVYRLLARRGRGAPRARSAAPLAGPTVDPRAEELRAKLAGARRQAAPEPEPASEPERAEGETPAETPEERRRRVHERGRAALDEMRGE